MLRAFLIAPLAAPAAYALFVLATIFAPVVFGSASLPSLRSLGELLLAIASLGVPIAYGAAALAGAPIYLLLRRAGAVAPLTLWITGAMIGAVVALLLAPRLRGELFSIRFPLWLGILLGGFSAEVFRRLLPTRGSEGDDSLAS